MTFCNYCQVLEFNDQDGYQAANEDGLPCLAFKPEQTTRMQSSKPSETMKVFPLAYKRSDWLPDLPELKRTGDNGCEFCNLLRSIIIEVSERRGYDGEVVISLSYSWESWRFRFPETGLSALIAKVAWLDGLRPHDGQPEVNALIFAVESDDGGYSLHLRVSCH